MTPLHLNDKPKIKPNIIEEVVGQELFLYDGASDRVYATNGGAALIWFLCDGNRSVAAIAQEISTVFDLPYTEVLDDVNIILAELVRLNLLESNVTTAVSRP